MPCMSSPGSLARCALHFFACKGLCHPDLSREKRDSFLEQDIVTFCLNELTHEKDSDVGMAARHFGHQLDVQVLLVAHGQSLNDVAGKDLKAWEGRATYSTDFTNHVPLSISRFPLLPSRNVMACRVHQHSVQHNSRSTMDVAALEGRRRALQATHMKHRDMGMQAQ